MINFRDVRLLHSARQLPCQHCGRDDRTVVAAHSNQLIHGKGMGIKAHDCFIAALCRNCHMELDQGKSMDKQARKDFWQTAHDKTILELFRRNLIGVK